MMFSSDAANAAFAAEFVDKAQTMLAGEIRESSMAYKELGGLWANTQRAMMALRMRMHTHRRTIPEVGLAGLRI